MKDKIVLVSLEKVNFKNDETGEVKEMCKMNYLMTMDPTDRIVGCSMFEGYLPIDCFDKLHKYLVIPRTEYVYERRPLKNGCKYIPIKIAEENLRKS